MPPYSSSLALRDYLRPYLRLLGAWDRQHLYDLCRGILQSRSSVLSRSGRTRLQREDGMRARLDNWVKRMSALLEALPWHAIHAIHRRRLRSRQGAWHLVVHDMSDIAKPFAEKLEGLTTVRDGSTGALVPGYTFCMSIGVGRALWDIHPIDAALLNPLAENFTSQNDACKEQIRNILSSGIGNDLLHVFDRGFDDEKYFHFFDGEEMAWMVRLKENRIVTFRGEEHRLDAVVETILGERSWSDGMCTYGRSDIGITITHDGRGGRIPAETRTYVLVAVRRPKYARPMLLLLNGRVHDIREATRLYADYLERWEVEDCIRFLKQSLKTEQMQLRTFERLRCFLHLQVLLVDFLLREYDRGVRPPGAELREVLLRSIDGDTRILSPYLLTDRIGEQLLAGQRCADRDLVPHASLQCCLFPTMDTE